MRAVVEGLFAGWAIAIPVGAIGVLILDRAATRGLGTGAAAALGTAAADFFYASVAVAVGEAVVAVVPSARATAMISGGVLFAVAVWMFVGALRPTTSTAEQPRQHAARTVATFFALTVVNPVTVVYFAALVASLDRSILTTTGDRVLFAVAAFAASLSWQLVLAGFGTVVGRRMPESVATLLRVVGALAVLGFAIRAGVRAFS